MSNQALDLLIEYELLKSNGAAIDAHSLPTHELSKRYSAYANARKTLLSSDIHHYEPEPGLNAQFSTWSSKPTKEKILSSLLVYKRVVINDPLVSSASSISIDNLVDGINLLSWLHPLIRAGFVSVFPIDFYNKPSQEIPLLQSNDAFRSSIPAQIHDYAHQNATLKSVIQGKQGEMFILSENASVKRRTALNVEFKDDILYSGVGLFLFRTLQSTKKQNDDTYTVESTWDKDGTLSEERFQTWSYQATNQAMMARLAAIYNQSHLAQRLGNTYITESPFESKILSFAQTESAEKISPAVDFLTINDSFIQIESPETIINLREKHPTAFERFNSSLLSASLELHSIDSIDFDKKSKALLHREILPQVDECRNAIKQTQSGLLKGSLVSMGGVTLAISTGSILPIIPSLLYSAASALTEALPALSEFQSHKSKPSYIWHRITK